MIIHNKRTLYIMIYYRQGLCYITIGKNLINFIHRRFIMNRTHVFITNSALLDIHNSIHLFNLFPIFKVYLFSSCSKYYSYLSPDHTIHVTQWINSPRHPISVIFFLHPCFYSNVCGVVFFFISSSKRIILPRWQVNI